MIEYEIEEALCGGVCPICSTVQDRMDEKLRWFALEGHHELSTLKDIYECGYICDRHKEELMKIGDTLSITFEFLIQQDISLFEMFFENNMKNLKSHATDPSRLKCKFCEDEAKIEEYAISTLFKMLKSGGNRALYKKSKGLCRRHLFKLIKMSQKKDDIAGFLLEDEIERLKVLQKSFETYFHKLDYRFADEEKGSEQRAWLEALNFYSNDKK